MERFSDFLTAPRAAELVGVTPQTITGWCRRYPGLAVRVIGRWRVDAAALDRVLCGQPPEAGGDHAHATDTPKRVRCVAAGRR